MSATIIQKLYKFFNVGKRSFSFEELAIQEILKIARVKVLLKLIKKNNKTEAKTLSENSNRM